MGNSFFFFFYMDSECTIPLKSTDSEKDVGVTFSTVFKFKKHISNVIKKANQLTGLVKRSFVHLDKTLL